MVPDTDAADPRDADTATVMVIVDAHHRVRDETADAARHGDLWPAAARTLAHFLDHYGPHDSDRIDRAFTAWRAITGNPIQLCTGAAQSGSDWHRWYALCTSVADAHAEAETYATWRHGDVVGYIIAGPDGREIGDGWGYYDRTTATADYREVIDHHVQARTQEAARVGAGFIGVI